MANKKSDFIGLVWPRTDRENGLLLTSNKVGSICNWDIQISATYFQCLNLNENNKKTEMKEYDG